MTIYNVEGKKFDTEKAEFVASSKMPYKDSGYDGGLGRWHELYRTEKGNWVMLSVSCWQGERSSAYIVSDETAKKFIMEYGDDGTIKKYCDDIEEI